MAMIDAPSDRDYREWLYPSDDPGEDPENVAAGNEFAVRFVMDDGECPF